MHDLLNLCAHSEVYFPLQTLNANSLIDRKLVFTSNYALFYTSSKKHASKSYIKKSRLHRKILYPNIKESEINSQRLPIIPSLFTSVYRHSSQRQLEKLINNKDISPDRLLPNFFLSTCHSFLWPRIPYTTARLLPMQEIPTEPSLQKYHTKYMLMCITVKKRIFIKNIYSFRIN